MTAGKGRIDKSAADELSATKREYSHCDSVYVSGVPRGSQTGLRTKKTALPGILDPEFPTDERENVLLARLHPESIFC